MRVLLSLPLFCSLLFIAPAGFAQSLSGLLKDVDNQPVPYARISVPGMQTGVLSGEDGTFALDLSPGSYRITVEHVAYEKEVVSVTIRKGQNERVEISLRPAGYAISEVQITGGKRDPAYAIMEQLIAHKQAQIRELPPFIRETYLKIRLEQDTAAMAAPAKPAPRKRTSVYVTALPWPTEAAATLLDTLYPPPPPDTTVRQDTLTLLITTLPWPTEMALDTNLRMFPLLQTTLPWPTDSALALAGKYRPRPERGPERHIRAIVELQATAYFEAPSHYRTVLHAYRQHTRNDAVFTDVVASNELNYRRTLVDPYLYNPDPTQATFNFYRNLVSVRSLADVPWVSPLHSELWRLTYSYKLVEQKLVDGWLVYKIAVTPKNDEGNVVEGHLWVVDGAWVLREVDLDLSPGSLSFFRKFHLHHRYQMQPDGQWLAAEEEYTYEIKDGDDLLKGSSRARHTDYQTNVNHPKGWFGNEVVTVEEQAFDQDSSFWAGVSDAPPSVAERRFAHRLDSLAAWLRSPEYLREQDSLENQLSIIDILWRGVTYNHRAGQWRMGIYPLVSVVRPGIGELRYGVGGEFRKIFARYTVLQMQLDGNYGPSTNTLKGGTEVSFLYAPKRFARASFRIGDRYQLITPNQTITAIFTQPSFFVRKYIGVGHQMELANGLTLAVNADYAYSQPSGQTLFGYGENPAPDTSGFDPFVEVIGDVTLYYTPFNKYQMLPYRKVNLGSKWPTFSLHYKKAFHGIGGSDTDFDLIRFRMQHEFTVGVLGTSRWSLDFGTYPNQDSLPEINYIYFRGSDPFLFVNPLQNFQLLGETFKTPNEYISGHYTHDFGRALTNKLPLVRRSQLMTSAGGSILWIRDAQFWHSEVYAGFQYPFRIRRERFKVGAFVVAAYGTYPQALSAQVKIGVSFYDQVRRRWEY